MIEINLLPEELLALNKKTEGPPPYYLYLIPILVAVMVLLHALFGVLLIAKNITLGRLNKAWEKRLAERSQVEALKQETTLRTQDIQILQQSLSQRIDWSLKLSRLSETLPTGIWFTQLAVENADFVLRGSVFSPAENEVAIVNTFLNALRGDESFMSSFASLELGPLKRRVIGGHDALDFTITGKITP